MSSGARASAAAQTREQRKQLGHNASRLILDWGLISHRARSGARTSRSVRAPRNYRPTLGTFAAVTGHEASDAEAAGVVEQHRLYIPEGVAAEEISDTDTDSSDDRAASSRPLRRRLASGTGAVLDNNERDIVAQVARDSAEWEAAGRLPAGRVVPSGFARTTEFSRAQEALVQLRRAQPGVPPRPAPELQGLLRSAQPVPELQASTPPGEPVHIDDWVETGVLPPGWVLDSGGVPVRALISAEELVAHYAVRIAPPLARGGSVWEEPSAPTWNLEPDAEVLLAEPAVLAEAPRVQLTAEQLLTQRTAITAAVTALLPLSSFNTLSDVMRMLIADASAASNGN